MGSASEPRAALRLPWAHLVRPFRACKPRSSAVPKHRITSMTRRKAFTFPHAPRPERHAPAWPGRANVVVPMQGTVDGGCRMTQGAASLCPGLSCRAALRHGRDGLHPMVAAMLRWVIVSRRVAARKGRLPRFGYGKTAPRMRLGARRFRYGEVSIVIVRRFGPAVDRRGARRRARVLVQSPRRLRARRATSGPARTTHLPRWESRNSGSQPRA